MNFIKGYFQRKKAKSEIEKKKAFIKGEINKLENNKKNMKIDETKVRCACCNQVKPKNEYEICVFCSEYWLDDFLGRKSKTLREIGLVRLEMATFNKKVGEKLTVMKEYQGALLETFNKSIMKIASLNKEATAFALSNRDLRITLDVIDEELGGFKKQLQELRKKLQKVVKKTPESIEELSAIQYDWVNYFETLSVSSDRSSGHELWIITKDDSYLLCKLGDNYGEEFMNIEHIKEITDTGLEYGLCSNTQHTGFLPFDNIKITYILREEERFGLDQYSNYAYGYNEGQVHNTIWKTYLKIDLVQKYSYGGNITGKQYTFILKPMCVCKSSYQNNFDASIKYLNS